MQSPEPLVYPAQGKHTATVIMLQGLGDTGHGWFDVGPMLAAKLPHVKFIFPTAPTRPITLNGGMRMTGWYDIQGLDDINEREDKDGVLASIDYVKGLIAEEETNQKIPPHRVVVGGFSQGGAIALGMLRTGVPLAGIMGLSTYLPIRTHGTPIDPDSLEIPVFQAHGNADMVVAFDFGQKTNTFLSTAGIKVDYHVYPGMGHSACQQELQDVADWLKKVLP